MTDINLARGGIDGWDVARHAREIDPISVVHMSGKIGTFPKPLVKNLAQKEPSANIAARLGRSVGATRCEGAPACISLKVPRQGGPAAEEAATE